jgi:hypothetical protein
MHLTFHMFKAGIATAISLWMAVLACFMGCTLPALANPDPFHTSSTQKSVAEHSQSDPMANMEDCPHHSGGNAPGKPSDRKPVPAGGMSCCPLEVTVAPKANTATLGIAPAHAFVLVSNFNLVTVRFYRSVEIIPSGWHSGRDTLLESHLLRV